MNAWMHLFAHLTRSEGLFITAMVLFMLACILQSEYARQKRELARENDFHSGVTERWTPKAPSTTLP